MVACSHDNPVSFAADAILQSERQQLAQCNNLVTRLPLLQTNNGRNLFEAASGMLHQMVKTILRVVSQLLRL